MLTVKQNGVRIANPDLTTSQTEELNRESIFKILVVECGFQATDRKEVWTHTKDDKFSTQLFSEDNVIFFEYKYKSDSSRYKRNITNLEFISYFLEESRKFFQKMKLSE